MVAIVLLLYDIVLTLRQEYEYIWRSPKSSFSRLLYAWNRYMILFFSVLTLGTIPPLSNTVSTCLLLSFHIHQINHASTEVDSTSMSTFPKLTDSALACSCTTIVWLNQSVYFLNFLGPASAYVPRRTCSKPLITHASVYHPASVRALKEEQTLGRGRTGAKPGSIHYQCGQASPFCMSLGSR